MASRPNQVAPVKWWSADRITVQCPYCTKTHGHSFPRPGNDGVKYGEFWRRGDCKDGGINYYVVAFPFDEAKSVTGYEINKQEGTFVSARFLNDRDASEAKSVAETQGNREERPKFNDGSKLSVPSEFNRRQITCQRCFVSEAVSSCVCGDVIQVEQFIAMFRDHNDYNIFLHGEDEDGYTVLGLAAMGTKPAMIALLLRHGCDVNACSDSGRTPLMEAALWGRSETLKILLKHGAHKTMRDHNGKLALDLAQICEENEEERHRRVPNFSEVAYLARKARREIIRLLELPVTPSQIFGFDTLDSQRHFAVQPDHSIALVTPIEQLASSTRNSAEGSKELAVMDRGEQFPHVTASSRGVNGFTEVTVSGQSWSALVRRVAKCVEFSLLSVPNQKESSSELCSMNHPEMHLIAYFIDKHVILPDEVVTERELEDLVEWRYNQASDDEGHDDVKRIIALTQLSQAKPPLSLLSATIVASTPACFDCKEFCNRVNAFFGLHLRLQYPHQGEDNDASVSELSLEDLAASCGEMHEAGNLCRSVLSRLTTCLDGVTVIPQPRRYLSLASETPSAKSLAARFDEILRRFSGDLVAWRFATARSLVDELLQLQDQLDKISTDTSEWRARWGDEVESMKTQLRSIVERSATSVLGDLSEAPTTLLDETMILLAHEIKTHMTDPFFSTEELRLVLDGITGMTRSVAPVVEAWFVPRHEVFYNDEKPLGSGSFAKVYRGKWHETEVVVKCVKITSDDEMRTFRREVRIWTKISHKHVVRFFRACDVGSPCFILCERATEGTLRTYLYKQRKEGRLLAWRKLHEAALGLLFLHRQGIVHGDLKNDNILVGGDGKAMLSDFGLSIDETGSKAIVEKWGAVRYRAPEQVVGLDGRSFAADVYSLGMCIVEAVTGRMPWGDVPDSAVAFHLRNRKTLKQPTELDENAWGLVTSMTSFDPMMRIPLESVVEGLEAFALQEEEREWEARMALKRILESHEDRV